jgi:hypothetical protein
VVRWCRCGLSVADPLVCRCLVPPCFPFHIPLIEPDRRIYRIRLSEKVSRCRPREAARPVNKADEAELFVEAAGITLGLGLTCNGKSDAKGDRIEDTTR